MLNLRARLLSLRFNKGIWLALTGVSSDPPFGYALSARSFALGGRSKLRPEPIGSISQEETASCVLARNLAWTKRICGSADSHYRTAVLVQLEVDRSHVVWCLLNPDYLRKFFPISHKISPFRESGPTYLILEAAPKFWKNFVDNADNRWRINVKRKRERVHMGITVTKESKVELGWLRLFSGGVG